MVEVYSKLSRKILKDKIIGYFIIIPKKVGEMLMNEGIKENEMVTAEQVTKTYKIIIEKV